MTRVVPLPIDEGAEGFYRDAGVALSGAAALHAILRPTVIRPNPDTTSHLRLSGVWAAVVTATGAASTSTTAADLLAAEFLRLSGSSAARASGPTAPGTRVGLASEWSLTIPDGGDWLIGTTGGTAYVLGRTSRGLTVAVRRLLLLLGYYPLTTVWDLAPHFGSTIDTPVDTGTIPFRFFNHGVSLVQSGAGTTRQTDWTARNGIVNDGLWAYGHAYGAIKAAKAADFADNPNWLAGDGSGTKFCTFEAGLQADSISYSRAQFTPTNGRHCTSVGTSDGSLGWDLVCAGTGEQALYNPSDRQIKLANVVQAALTSDDPDHHCSIQAYADCSPPPTLTIDPNILVIWATAFMQAGLSAEAVRDAYLAKGMGLHAPYSYASEWLWDFDLPCKARATRRDDLSVEADRLTGDHPPIGWANEASAAWVPFGRWYWALTALLFGEDPLDRWDAWPSLAFPHATTEALAYYAVVDQNVPLSSDLVHRMAATCQALILVLPATGDETERALDLARWAVYVALWRVYLATPGAPTFSPVLQWCYRIRARDVTTYTAFYDLNTYQIDRKAVAALHSLSDLTTANVGTIYADTPTTRDEILALLTSIVATNALIPFTPVNFSDTDLVRVSGLTHISTTPGAFVAQVKDQEFWYHASGADILTFQAGVVRQDVGAVHVRIYEFSSGDDLWEEDIPEDKVSRNTASGFWPAIVTKPQVLYKIAITNAKPGLTWSWGSGTGIVFQTTDDLAVFTSSYSGYFYVPQGTTQIGWFAQSGTIRMSSADNVDRPIYNADGTLVGTVLTASNNYYITPVPEGCDRQLWRVRSPSNKFRLYTVPRELFHDPTEVLLPRSVVESDALTLADATPPPTPQFPVLTYTRDLVAPSPPLTATGPRGASNYLGFDGDYWWYGRGMSETFTLKAGIVSHIKGPSTVTVTDTTTGLMVAVWSSDPDQVVREFTYTALSGHLYRLAIDVNGGVVVGVPVGALVVFETLGRSQLHMPFIGSYSAWAYVPRGTTNVEGWFDGGSIKVYDKLNKLVTNFHASAGYYSFAVPAGKDGAPMRFTGIGNRLGFTSIPPWMSFDPSGIIVPAEVAAADGL